MLSCSWFYVALFMLLCFALLCFILLGADEKLLRVFDAPSIVLEGLGLVPGDHVQHTPSTTTNTTSSTTTPSATAATAMRVHRAYIPELGMSLHETTPVHLSRTITLSLISPHTHTR